jgi:hypothetical protein
MPFSLSEATRYIIRKQHGFDENDIVIGWLDAKKRVENVIDAAAISSLINAHLQFVMIDWPDAFIQKYAA